MQRLILWDVDRTLLHTDGIAGEEMRASMAQIFGPVTKRERTFYSGKTDWSIIQNSFPDFSPEAIATNMDLFCDVYAHNLNQRRDDLHQRSETLPGVVEILRQLQQHDHIIQAPLTGNIAAVAHIKLEVLGLLNYLDHDVGAYGNDAENRADLVPIAARRAAEKYGTPLNEHTIIVIGDTPHDIACGKAHNARTVAIATGPYTLDDLQRHEPDALLTDLRDTATAIVAILGG